MGKRGNMEQRSELKSARLLEIYTRLEQGRTLKKADLAQEFHVTQRSIQRDVEDLRCFLAERHLEREVIYDGKQRGYRMVSGNPRGLTNSEILAVCKILLESRSLPAKDMGGILDKLIDCAVPQESQKAVRELVANEKLHYIPPTTARACWAACGSWGRPSAISRSLRSGTSA